MNFEAQPSGGSNTYRKVAANDTNAASIKATPGKVLGWHISNKAASARYVKLYNKASAPTVGTDVPALTIQVPAGLNDVLVPTNMGPQFDTGIAVGVVTGSADSDTTAPTAGDVFVQIFWA